jgi:hypothetical protein
MVREGEVIWCREEVEAVLGGHVRVAVVEVAKEGREGLGTRHNVTNADIHLVCDALLTTLTSVTQRTMSRSKNEEIEVSPASYCSCIAGAVVSMNGDNHIHVREEMATSDPTTD